MKYYVNHIFFNIPWIWNKSCSQCMSLIEENEKLVAIKTLQEWKKKAKKVIKKGNFFKIDLEFVGNAPMLVQIVMGKTIKTIQVYHNFKNILNYKNFHVLCSWNIFKVWLLISSFTLHKDLILNQLHINHKSFIS